MNIADELLKLQQLRQSGAISEEEFARAKAKILDAQPNARAPFENAIASGDADMQTRQWGMTLHLTMLLNFLIPPCGIIAPILIWQLKKNELPGLDPHGMNAVNWLISALIYAVVGLITAPLMVGFFILPIVAILCLIFPIIAAIKANDGEAWAYPGAISFLK